MASFDALVDGLELSLTNQDSAKQVVDLALDRISSDPDNPRKTFDAEKLRELADSIIERGILQPIIVRPVEEGRFIVRMGDRRFRAATLAGLASIPAIISETEADENDLVDQVIENDQRVDLTASELAAAIGKLLSAKIKQAEIAKRLGRPKGLISMYAAVSTMPPLFSDLLETHAIRTVYELHLGWKVDPARVERFVENKGGETITTNEARALVKEIENPPAPPAPSESLFKQTSGTDGTPSPSSDDAAASETVVKTTRAKGKGKPEPLAPIFVDVGGRRGRIVLPAVVDVLFEGEDKPASHKLDELRPVRD